MATQGTSKKRKSEDNGPEGLLIGIRLQELADELGLNQRQLALRLDIDPRHFNSLWKDKKKAGLPLIVKIARRSGRSIGWVCGEEAARPQIGTANAQGLVTMATNDTKIAPGIVYFLEASGTFPAGERVLVDPSDSWSEGRWLLVAARNRTERFFARTDGELLVFQEDRHEVLGVIVGTITPPPSRPSARR